MLSIYSIPSLAAQQAAENSTLIWVLGFIVVVVVVAFLLILASRNQPEVEVHDEVHHDEQVEEIEEPAAETVPEPEPEPEPVAEETTPAEPDKLTIIEGIGPKVQSLLQTAGISTFADLAAADIAKLDELLDANKMQYMNPKSWPEQAKLASEGKLEELKTLQDNLKGGL